MMTATRHHESGELSTLALTCFSLRRLATSSSFPSTPGLEVFFLLERALFPLLDRDFVPFELPVELATSVMLPMLTASWSGSLEFGWAVLPQSPVLLLSSSLSPLGRTAGRMLADVSKSGAGRLTAWRIDPGSLCPCSLFGAVRSALLLLLPLSLLLTLSVDPSRPRGGVEEGDGEFVCE